MFLVLINLAGDWLREAWLRELEADQRRWEKHNDERANEIADRMAP